MYSISFSAIRHKQITFLLLDEPFANLDKKSKRNIMSFFKEYSKKHIVIIATHDQDTIDMFDQVINIQDRNAITLRDNYL